MLRRCRVVNETAPTRFEVQVQISKVQKHSARRNCQANWKNLGVGVDRQYKHVAQSSCGMVVIRAPTLSSERDGTATNWIKKFSLERGKANGEVEKKKKKRK
ncbi:uncharacterized protein LOC143916908 [Arctopsyche grandis]|uniref:uncharacterized protein LOC143916908 n=1 Tax=Arctopsyche grandis TaxID=121162 RepID=UPI00406DA477